MRWNSYLLFHLSLWACSLVTLVLFRSRWLKAAVGFSWPTPAVHSFQQLPSHCWVRHYRTTPWQRRWGKIESNWLRMSFFSKQCTQIKVRKKSLMLASKRSFGSKALRVLAPQHLKVSLQGTSVSRARGLGYFQCDRGPPTIKHSGVVITVVLKPVHWFETLPPLKQPLIQVLDCSLDAGHSLLDDDDDDVTIWMILPKSSVFSSEISRFIQCALDINMGPIFSSLPEWTLNQ